MPLSEYINTHYGGNKAAFARACNVLPQQVAKWINMGCIIVNEKLYSPRREMPLKNN